MRLLDQHVGRDEVGNARFYAGDVRLALRELVARARRPDVLVVDPRAPIACTTFTAGSGPSAC